MGFFSWLTADTGEPIRNAHTGECRTVYMLRPGRRHVEESAYEGYGVFGGIDAYEFLAEMNGYGNIRRSGRRTLGIAIENGSVYVDSKDHSVWVFNMDGLADLLGIKGFVDERGGPFGTYGDPQPAYGGRTPNELIELRRWRPVPVREVLRLGDDYKPLKFSFDPKARYAKLPGSEVDPDQGYF